MQQRLNLFMAITDIFRVNKIKTDLQKADQERDILRTTLAELGQTEAADLKLAIEKLKIERDALLTQNKKSAAEHESLITELDKQIAYKRKSLIVLDDEILLQTFGLYKPKYGLENSDTYKRKLTENQTKQSEMIKTGKAAIAGQEWTINGSKSEGAKMVKDYLRLILRAFNNECDAGIAAVKFNNIDSIETRINKAFGSLNDLGTRMHISISREYLNLRLQELFLVHEYQQKKQEEKEEQKRIREQMREEAKLMREIEEMKAKLVKEETHFNRAIERIETQFAKATSDSERALLEREKASILKNLDQIEKDKLDIRKREQNTRAGYVYVISNIGAFGENVYKIGVTRRLDPQERIDELGDASVPFEFDVHALIFSDDAPALENALHKAFDKKKLNMINQRREFFYVTLNEIEEVVKKNFNKPVEFIRLAEASQYRESLALRDQK